MICKCCNQEIEKKRTSQQNRAMHKWFELLAEALNDAGFDIKTTIRQDLDIPWTATTIKELLWRPIQKVYKRKQSTTQLQTKDIDAIYDIINREIGQRTGIDVPPFPSTEQMIAYEENK
jgi:hypothetical protein